MKRFKIILGWIIATSPISGIFAFVVWTNGIYFALTILTITAIIIGIVHFGISMVIKSGG